jgi:hypothetical protein
MLPTGPAISLKLGLVGLAQWLFRFSFQGPICVPALNGAQLVLRSTRFVKFFLPDTLRRAQPLSVLLSRSRAFGALRGAIGWPSESSQVVDDRLRNRVCRVAVWRERLLGHDVDRRRVQTTERA